MSTGVLAIDIDLGRCTAVHSERGVICHGVDMLAPGTGFNLSAETILIEVAGPILHHDESHSYRRWMIYNSMTAALLVAALSPLAKVLVATSTAWTKGYSEVERDAIAGILPTKYKMVTRKNKITREPLWLEAHDIRECRCMLYLFARDPKPWKSLTHYLKELVGK